MFFAKVHVLRCWALSRLFLQNAKGDDLLRAEYFLLPPSFEPLHLRILEEPKKKHPWAFLRKTLLRLFLIAEMRHFLYTPQTFLLAALPCGSSTHLAKPPHVPLRETPA